MLPYWNESYSKEIIDEKIDEQKIIKSFIDFFCLNIDTKSKDYLNSNKFVFLKKFI